MSDKLEEIKAGSAKGNPIYTGDGNYYYGGREAVRDIKWLIAEVERQKEHRKWALHEMLMWRAVSDCVDEDCKYHFIKALEAKDE